jgi:hypothetical protein
LENHERRQADAAGKVLIADIRAAGPGHLWIGLWGTMLGLMFGITGLLRTL